MSRDPEADTLPAGLYEGGFANSREALELALQMGNVGRPITLYYPGSSSDASFARIEGVRAIHVDHALDDVSVQGFQRLGAEAFCVDAHMWHPPRPVDVVAFINPSGINEVRVVDASGLRQGGIVLWASWSGCPAHLQQDPALHLLGVINNSDSGLTVDDGNMDAYFNLKDFDELTENEREQFIGRLNAFLDRQNMEVTTDISVIYEALKQPDNFRLAFDIGYQPPYKKQGTFFVFQRNSMTAK